MDFGSLLDQAKQAVNNELEQVKSVGVPALQTGLEQWGQKVLQDQAASLGKDAQKSQAQLNTAVNQVLSAPSQPGSFGSFLSGAFQNAGLQSKGLLVVGGVLAVLAVGYFLARK